MFGFVDLVCKVWFGRNGLRKVCGGVVVVYRHKLCFWEASECFMEISRSFKDVSREFQWCFKEDVNSSLTIITCSSPPLENLWCICRA